MTKLQGVYQMLFQCYFKIIDVLKKLSRLNMDQYGIWMHMVQKNLLLAMMRRPLEVGEWASFRWISKRKTPFQIFTVLQGVSSNLPLTMCDANISCIYKRVVSPEMWNTYNPENKYSLRIEPPNGSFHHMIPKVQNLLFQGDMFRFYLCAFRAREISFLPGYIQIALVVTTGTYCVKFSQGPISTHSWTKSWKQVHHVEKKSDLYNHYQKSPSVKAAHNFHRNWVSLPQNDPQCCPKASFAIFVATSFNK